MQQSHDALSESQDISSQAALFMLAESTMLKVIMKGCDACRADESSLQLVEYPRVQALANSLSTAYMMFCGYKRAVNRLPR